MLTSRYVLVLSIVVQSGILVLLEQPRSGGEEDYCAVDNITRKGIEELNSKVDGFSNDTKSQLGKVDYRLQQMKLQIESVKQRITAVKQEINQEEVLLQREMEALASRLERTIQNSVQREIRKQTTELKTYSCKGTPGWRRVAFINITDSNTSCPTGLVLKSHSKRTCGRSQSGRAGCASTKFHVGGEAYSKVCGMIKGYQFGTNSAFYGYRHHSQDIDGFYADGVSLTHGRSGMRQHIWTFAAGSSEVTPGGGGHNCPCDIRSYNIPAFVGNDYFCESGLNAPWTYPSRYIFYPNDVLWDGLDCLSTSTCCELNNPPWFMKVLPNPTLDDIELRICGNVGSHIDDVPLEFIELYVQ